MDLSLSEDQELLQKSAREFLETECPPKLVRNLESDDLGYSRELWCKMADLGWMGLNLPEAYGGSDFTYVDLIVLLEEMGRSLVPGPFLPLIEPVASTLALVGTEDQKQEWLPGIINGTKILAFAQQEPTARFAPFNLSTTLSGDGDSLVLNGTKLFVSFAHVADGFLVTAKDGDGISLAIVDKNADGIAITGLKAMDNSKTFEVTFTNTPVKAANVIGSRSDAKDILDKALQRWTIASCAWMVGQSDRALNMSVEYSKTRVQFGRPIGSFQALQHKAADMAVDVEGGRMVTYQAAWAVQHGDDNAQQAVSTAKAWVSDASRRVFQQAHQMHGAIGFTMEYDLQLYTRRGKLLEVNLGDSDYHRAKVAAAMGL